MDYEEDCMNEDSVHVSKRYGVVVLAGVPLGFLSTNPFTISGT